MSSDIRQRIQIVLVIAIVVAAARTGWIIYQRRSSNQSERQKQANAPLNPDYYVTPKKLYAYDLKSARQLTQQPVWVKEGYKYSFYTYQPSTHHSDLSQEAGVLLPLERLEIQDVVLDSSPTQGQRQVMAVFERDGKHYAFPIGVKIAGDYKIYADEILFIQDPKQLYKHWPADVWEAIEKHQVKPGMSELQADFAIGMGVPEYSSDPEVKTVHYPNGGKPLTITYRGGKVADIKPGSAS